ncbi:MAG: hypothetical protein ACP5N2_00135 [Candidatus Nanoarchaeia archaeon]
MKDLQHAIKEAELILQREYNISDLNKDEFNLFMRKDKAYRLKDLTEIRKKQIIESYLNEDLFIKKSSPNIIGRGTHQIVFRLSNNFAMKLPIEDATSTHYHLFMYASSIPGNDAVLRSWGLPAYEEHYFAIYRNNEKFNIRKLKKDDYNETVLITYDISEGRKYLVESLAPAHFKTLDNGCELKDMYESYFKILMDSHNKKKEYILEANSHITTEGISEAIQHMFIMQINSELNTGNLITGDLDHIKFIYNYILMKNKASNKHQTST